MLGVSLLVLNAVFFSFGCRCVVSCLSPKYQTSENCMLEYVYVFQRKKPVVPLMMNKDFHMEAEGPLALLLGASNLSSSSIAFV